MSYSGGRSATTDPLVPTGATATVSRPLDFLVALPDAASIESFNRYCAASLLAPGNVPALGKAAGSLHLALHPDSKAMLEADARFRALAGLLAVRYVSIDDLGGSIPLIAALQAAHKAANCAILLEPRSVYSNGAIPSLLALARCGAHAILGPRVPVLEDALLLHIERLAARQSLAQEVTRHIGLEIVPRELVKAVMLSLDDRGRRCEWDSPEFSELPWGFWCTGPNRGGMVLHSLAWSPLLLDFGAIAFHDAEAVRLGSEEYVYRNYGSEGRIAVAEDSDAILCLSWSGDSSAEEPSAWPFAWPLLGKVVKGAALYRSAFDTACNPLQRRLFRQGVRWHAAERNGAWRRTQARANRIVRASLDWPLRPHRLMELALNPRWAERLTKLSLLVEFYWSRKSRMPRILSRALRGDPDARASIRYAGRYLMARFMRQPPP